MEVGQEHSEDYSIGGLLSPEKAKQTSYNEDEVFIFEEDMKFFEAIKKSFEASSSATRPTATSMDGSKQTDSCNEHIPYDVC